jgi:hypothetical protein
MAESTRLPTPQAIAMVPDIGKLLLPELEKLQRRLEQFRQQPLTPTAVFELEQQLRAILNEAGRRLLQHTLSQLEAVSLEEMPQRISFQGETYRRRPQQPKTIYSSFGPLEYSRFRYEACERGQRSLFPLDLQLGLEAHLATPLLAERVGRLAVDHEQSQVLGVLARDHGVCWSVSTLRKVTAALSDGLASFRQDAQVRKACLWLRQAVQSKGRHRPVLAVGRDGIMVPMRNQGYKEASSATLAIYDRRGKRLGTLYLGYMPESGQQTMTQQLTALIEQVLSAWHAQDGGCPRLVYLTDGGHHPREFYVRVLRQMLDPWNLAAKHPLAWQWVLDYWHVCGYVNKLAVALFGASRKADQWFGKMRRWLRDRARGITQVLRSATQYQQQRRLSKTKEEAFTNAYVFLRKNSRWMQYAAYRRQGLPIGSGVTEASCKTVFTQRLKRSGMSWEKASGQVIVNLRILHLSRVWPEVYAQRLAAQALPLGASYKAATGKILKKAS